MSRARVFAAALLLLLTVIIPASAQTQTEDAAGAVECPPGTPNLVIADGGGAAAQALLNRILSDYAEACPNVTAAAFQSPEIVTDRFGFYNQFLRSRSPAIDIYAIDVIWPGALADYMVDLNDYFDAAFIDQFLDEPVTNNTVDGRLIGIPWYIDAGMLYYRTDLLEKYGLGVPQTWEELESAAEIIQDGERAEGKTDFWGYLWQGGIGEPTTVNALEWQASSGGGTIIGAEGEIQVNRPETIEAIERGASWVGYISPPTVIGHSPSDSNNIWCEGNAAFMRNWSGSYVRSEECLAGQFDVTQLPAGAAGSSAATLGGWQLGVSRYSQNIPAAVALVEYLTSYDVQKLRAMENFYIPTIEALYEDPDLQAENPIFSRIREVFDNAVARPSNVVGRFYSRTSILYSNAVHSVLRGQTDAQSAMEILEFDLEDLMVELSQSQGTGG